ncbi:hypothetical protein DFH09DRAFT_1221845 [Mycena vulgaris]|nr:hypothetical protein DFH09DRAFT_1221845 [Mycena vulgaris]
MGLTIFLENDLLRASYSTVETVLKIVAALRRPNKHPFPLYGGDDDRSDEDWQLAVNAISICLKHHDLRAIISAPEMVQEIVAMLHSGTLSEQQSALEGLTIFLEDDLLRASYSTVETVLKIVAVLRRPNQHRFQRYGSDDARQLALNATTIFFKHDDLRAIISGPEMVQEIAAMLASETLSEKRSALKILALFLEDGKLLHSHTRCMTRVPADLLRASYLTAETVLKIVPVLRCSSQHFIKRDPSYGDWQLAFNVVNISLKHNDLRAIFCGPEILQEIVAMLHHRLLPTWEQCGRAGYLMDLDAAVGSGKSGDVDPTYRY